MQYFEDKEYFIYDGSFTTPPCDEGVKRVVYKDPLFISDLNLKTLSSYIGVSNRIVQPLGDRKITSFNNGSILRAFSLVLSLII